MNRLTILLQVLSFLVVLIFIRGGSWIWILILVILLALVYLSERATKKKLPPENKATPPQPCQMSRELARMRETSDLSSE